MARAQGAIQYAATDLTDTTPGQDLWHYTYLVSGFSFQANQGFSIFFDHLLYTSLQSPPPSVNGDWNVLAVQPDLLLRDAGFYDGLAMRNAPSLTEPFEITFVWQGQGTPESQPFTIYDSSFATMFSGQTVLVPEPSAISLVAATGLIALLGAGLRKRPGS